MRFLWQMQCMLDLRLLNYFNFKIIVKNVRWSIFIFTSKVGLFALCYLPSLQGIAFFVHSVSWFFPNRYALWLILEIKHRWYHISYIIYNKFSSSNNNNNNNIWTFICTVLHAAASLYNTGVIFYWKIMNPLHINHFIRECIFIVRVIIY